MSDHKIQPSIWLYIYIYIYYTVSIMLYHFVLQNYFLRSLASDLAQKQQFAAALAKHPWFEHSGYEVPGCLARSFW